MPPLQAVSRQNNTDPRPAGQGRGQSEIREALDGTQTVYRPNRVPESNRSNRVAPTLIEHAKTASGVRSWNCAGPEMPSTSVPEALK
eukprot:5055118-Alexandrium_andersonii.AAC.1